MAKRKNLPGFSSKNKTGNMVYGGGRRGGIGRGGSFGMMNSGRGGNNG